MPVLREADDRGRAAGRARGSGATGRRLTPPRSAPASYGNVPPERAAQVMGMLLGVPVSAGFVDKAGSRLSAQLAKAGFDAAMLAALAAEAGAGR